MKARLILIVLAVSVGGCREPDTGTGSVEQDVVGSCQRIPAQLTGPERVCVDDLDCPCGSHCDDTVRRCTYSCMPPGQAPPGSGGTPVPGMWHGDPSACPTASECDDTGRCTGAADPLTVTALLSANPPMLATVAGGAAKPFDVRLRLTDTTPIVVEEAESTVVRLVAREGARVSCNGTTFSERCTLTDWTFALAGQGLQATKVAHVKTIAGTAPGRGEVVLAIDATRVRVIVPAPATPTPTNENGRYAGVATSPGYPGGIRVTAIARDRRLLVREPSRTLAPDGALLLDVNTAAAPTVRRKTAWLRETGAPATAGAIVGDYIAGRSTVDLATGTMSVPLTMNVPGTIGVGAWTVALTRAGDGVVECDAQTPCPTGNVCRPELQACVPEPVWTPPTAPLGNALIDQRSEQWWGQVAPLLGNAAQGSAFDTTGADLVESVLCSTVASTRGKLAASQVARGRSTPDPSDDQPSRSGDLDCIDRNGARTLSPGAVGLATLADRAGSDDEVLLQTVHARCMTDLAQSPPTTGLFHSHFAATVATCANLSRFVPALRLLATDPLNKSTIAELEPRARGLAVRLAQQWAMLQGFLATTGTSQEDYASFLNPTPASTTRTALNKVLDIVDRGWNALLDQRIAPMIRDAVRWSPSSDNEALRDQSRDYRLLKRPIVYWTFNTPSATPPGPAFDIIRGVELVPHASTVSVCRITSPSFPQGFNCPGLAATLPAEAPSLVDDPGLGGAGKIDNLTVTINVDARDFGGPGTSGPVSAMTAPEASSQACPDEGCDPPPDDEEDPPPRPLPRPAPPYRGGTLIATPTLAIAESVDPTTLAGTLVLAHPSATGVEITMFTGYGKLGTPGDTELLRAGSMVVVVRDAKRKLYTLSVRDPVTGVETRLVKSYLKDPSGTLDWVPAKTIRLGAAGALPPGHYWTPYMKSYGGHLDDVAVFDSALSATEISQLGAARQGNDLLRTVWPIDMHLQTPAADRVTQETSSPLGAQLLEAQVAELELGGRLLAAMQDRAQVACDADPTSTAAATARAEIEAAVARVGRMLRRSHLLEGIAETDASPRAIEARRLLGAKRIELARATEPARCTEPFQMADDEVPLYHDTIPEGMGETEAFFAASGFLQRLALEHANTAMARRTTAEAAYVNARTSQIQQIESDSIRADRLLAIKNQYGDGLRRLCGLTHQTNVDFVHDNFEEPDPQHPFVVESCYVVQTTACVTQHAGPFIEANPACYRGQLGENLMSLRSAYFAQQAAYQSWKAASDNAEAAERFCVWKEMDAFGCEALDRYELTDVVCPPDHQGTIELTSAFNDEIRKKQNARAFFTGFGNIVGNMLSGASGGAPGVFGGLVKGVSDTAGALADAHIQNRQRAHQLTLTRRAARADIEACWNQAQQYERGVQAAELSYKQALAQFEAGGIGFANGIGEGNQLTIELRAALAREASRPSIPIAFHYWLGGAIAAYETELEIARRYTYLALRATEYDMQDSYKVPSGGKPLRSAVLAATHPQQLLDQLTLMQAQTNQRMLNGRRPAKNHLTFDVGAWQWGLPVGSPLADRFDARLRDVIDKNGTYLGKGLRFSFIPRSDDDAPVWRCAERIWRVAVGAINFPADQSNFMLTKLIKRNTFASRRCGADGLQVARWRSKVNLFVATGQASTPDLDDPLPAHTPLVRLDTELQAFRERDDAYNNSSRELSLLGLFGDYVLLFPKAALNAGLVPRDLLDLNIRFDYLSVDDTPAIPLLRSGAAGGAPQVEIKVDEDPSPIIVD